MSNNPFPSRRECEIEGRAQRIEDRARQANEAARAVMLKAAAELRALSPLVWMNDQWNLDDIIETLTEGAPKPDAQQFDCKLRNEAWRMAEEDQTDHEADVAEYMAEMRREAREAV